MSNKQATEWHREMISDVMEAALCSLRDAKVLDRFYFAGGTGLAGRAILAVQGSLAPHRTRP